MGFFILSKRTLFKLVSFGILLIITAILGEISLRFIVKAWPFEKNVILAHLSPKDELLRFRYSHGGDRNSLGLRNREIQKKNEQFRVLFLGDSILFSAATSSGEMYTQVIERNLNKSRERKDKIEIINAGVPGYTTYQELEFLKAYGLDMKPDMVILCFVFNDLYYKYLHKPTDNNMLGNEPSFRLNRFDVRKFPGFFFARSYLIHEVVHVWDIVIRKLNLVPCYPFDLRGDFHLAWKDYGWRHTADLIGEMNGLLRTRGVPLHIVAFPVVTQVDDQYLDMDRDYVLYPQKRIREIAEQFGLPFKDLTEAIHNGGGTMLYRDFLHFKREGNDIVARELTMFLESHLP